MQDAREQAQAAEARWRDNEISVKRLRAREGYGLRVGDWRIPYSLDTQASILTVEAVETRGDAYR